MLLDHLLLITYVTHLLNFKFKVRVVGSKLREEGPRGARRSAWLLLAAYLYYQGWWALVFLQPGFLLSPISGTGSLYLAVQNLLLLKYTMIPSQEHLCYNPIVHWSRSSSLHRSSICLQIFPVYSGENTCVLTLGWHWLTKHFMHLLTDCNPEKLGLSSIPSDAKEC